MRTRFLATDYSTTTATATATGGGGPVETLEFVRLPLPHLPPPNYPSFSANFLQSFDEIPVFGFSREIDKLPIDDALSIFLSDVLPHFVDGAGFEEPTIYSNKEKSERRTVIYYGEKELDRLGSDKMEMEKDRKTSSNKDGDGLIFVQFEIPEMDISLLPSNAVHSQIECFNIFSEVLDAEFTMDLLNSELTLHDTAEIQRSLYSVDGISVEYSIEQKADLLEDADYVQGKLHCYNIKFPVFEVDMESLGVLGRIFLMDELLSFENIEKLQVTQPDEVISNKELLDSMESDLIKYLFHHSVAIHCHDDTIFSSQLECISMIELSHCQEYSTLHVNPDGYSIWSMDPILFDELMFLDLDPYNFCEIFSDSAKEIEAETCEYMFGEAMNFRSFSQLIVCHELTLMDDSFKSLPVPIFSDRGDTNSLHMLVEELLAQLDWQSSSASDGLYLDWPFLGGDDCESAKYSSCWKMLWEIDTYNIDVNMNSTDSGNLIFDFILSEGHSSTPNAENCKEILNLSCGDVSIFHSSDKADLSNLKNHGDRERINDDILLKSGVKNVPVFGESMSSDLEFFLNPRNYVIERENIPADKSVDTNTVSQVLMSTDDSAAANASTVVQPKWNVKIHKVQLSPNILLLLDYLWKNFLAMLEDDKVLVQVQNQYKASNDLMLLHLPIEMLKHHLQQRIASSTHVAHNNDDIMVMAMLCAVKQMGFYLCYYGIQATYLYMDKLSKSLDCVKSRLSFLYNLIRDENQKAEKELSIIHPSISVVKEILQTILSNSNSKVLIVSDQVFWWPLKRLLTSLKISCKELQHPFTPPCQQHQCCEITGTIMDILLYSDCCLVSHEYVSASFPFSKFSFILEYGGSNISSRISSICPKLDGLPTLYFLKVELEGSSIAKALSHGVCMPKSIKFEMTRNLDSAAAQKECKTKLEELLDTIPVKETYGNEPVEAANEDEDCTMLPVQSMPVGLESKQNLSCKPFGPNTVIIVNTRNFNEEMVISRRSTYQRILEMEQEGAQVVERDIDLPVDVIISSAVSLTWYDCRNIGKKASAPDEAFSCLPLCVESIAASILTSLSFAFSCCILIFEGECNFLCSIMESSDELYAAAASLGIDLQLFCSYSHEMTGEIILSCINVAAKLSRGLYPKMSDSESLAESFLTAFPSINPLSAHAILSLDAILGKFLELSNRGRICALQKYQVPDETIDLLSVISRYGEREDSKSGMTDCSSSLSAPDSENVQFKSASERKQPKYTHNLYDAGEPPNDLFHMESQKLLPDHQHNLPKLSVLCNSWLSGSAEISKSQQYSLSFNDKLLCHSQDIDADIMKSFDANMMKSIDKSSLPDFPLAKGRQISDDRERPWMPPLDIDCNPRWRSATALKNNFSRQSIKVTGILQGNSTGEPPNDLFHMESQKLLPDHQHNLPKLSVSCNSWLSGSAEISKSEQYSFSFNDKLLCHSQDIDADMMESIDKSTLHDFPLAKGLQISDEREKPWMPPVDIDCSPRWRSAMTLKNNSSRQSIKVTGIPQGNSTGEVIDVEDTPAFRENFSVANSSSFSPIRLDIEKDYAARNSRMNKRASSATNLPIFSDPTDIHSASGAWVSRNDTRQILREESRPHFGIIKRNNVSVTKRKGFVEEDMIEKVPQNSYKQSFQEKGPRSFGGTPLSTALHSTQPQGSPWTIEFLNRIREKSRLRKQSVSYDLCSPSFSSSGNTSKASKRKSPSNLEFYKYEGGSTPQKIVEEKRLKRFSQPLNTLKTKKASSSCPPSLTPVDKRARRTLSFSTNGSGGQSKLVWRDNNSHTTQRRL